MINMIPVERLKHTRVRILVLDLDRRRLLDSIEADVQPMSRFTVEL